MRVLLDALFSTQNLSYPDTKICYLLVQMCSFTDTIDHRNPRYAREQIIGPDEFSVMPKIRPENQQSHFLLMFREFAACEYKKQCEKELKSFECSAEKLLGASKLATEKLAEEKEKAKRIAAANNAAIEALELESIIARAGLFAEEQQKRAQMKEKFDRDKLHAEWVLPQNPDGWVYITQSKKPTGV